MTMVTTMELDETDAQPLDRPRPKVGRIPVTLRLMNESETPDEVWQETEATTRKGDTQFMLLLVTLFIIVNLTLITLLNHKDKNAVPKEAAAHHAAPAAAATPAASTAQQQAAPVPGAPAPATQATVNPSYITPVTPATTKSTAAPYQKVVVSSRSVSAPAALAPVPSLTTQQAPATQTSLPDAAPAAGTPAVSPEAAKRDLLSVINKDD